MGNEQSFVASEEASGNGGVMGPSRVNPNDPNLLCDLPFSLVLEIYTLWLPGGKAAMRDMIRLDTALCNKKVRSLLAEVYKEVDFDGFLLSDNALLVQRKMDWVTQNHIKFVDLELHKLGLAYACVPFFKQNGPHLKTLRIRDNTMFRGHWFQKCSVLETLMIEESPLTDDVAQILRTSPIKHLKLDNKFTPGAVLPMRVLQRCETVTRLSLTDYILLQDWTTVGRLFPNVTDFEMRGVTDVAVIRNLCRMWPNLHTLRIHNFQFLGEDIYTVLTESCPHLKRLYLRRYVSCNIEALFRFLIRSTNITCIRIDCKYIDNPQFSDLLVQLVVSKAALLEEFLIGHMMHGSDLFVAISTHCPNLRVLAVSTHNQPDEWNAMCNIYKKCTLLYELHINIHMATFELLDVKYCTNLQSLHIAGSVNIQRRDIVNIVSSCKALKFVEMSNPNIIGEMGGVYRGVKIALKADEA